MYEHERLRTEGVIPDEPSTERLEGGGWNAANPGMHVSTTLSQNAGTTTLRHVHHAVAKSQRGLMLKYTTRMRASHAPDASMAVPVNFDHRCARHQSTLYPRRSMCCVPRIERAKPRAGDVGDAAPSPCRPAVVAPRLVTFGTEREPGREPPTPTVSKADGGVTRRCGALRTRGKTRAWRYPDDPAVTPQHPKVVLKVVLRAFEPAEYRAKRSSGWIRRAPLGDRRRSEYHLALTFVRAIPTRWGSSAGSSRSLAGKRDPPDCSVAVLADEQRPVTGDGDADRARPHRVVVDDEARHEILVVPRSGIRNCVGLAVHASTGDVCCSTNERDGLGDDLVPDYITRVRRGGFYGLALVLPGRSRRPTSCRARGPTWPAQRSSPTCCCSRTRRLCR
jgi:hypothetical protein